MPGRPGPVNHQLAAPWCLEPLAWCPVWLPGAVSVHSLCLFTRPGCCPGRIKGIVPTQRLTAVLSKVLKEQKEEGKPSQKSKTGETCLLWVLSPQPSFVWALQKVAFTGQWGAGARFVLFSKMQAWLFPDVSTEVSHPLPRAPPALLFQAFKPPCSLHGLWVVWGWVLVLPRFPQPD